MVVQSNRDTSNQAIYQNNDGVGTLGGLAALGGMGALAYMLLRKGKGAGKALKAGDPPKPPTGGGGEAISDKQLQQAKEYIAEKKKVIENGQANQTVAGLKKTADAKNGTNLADDVAAIKQKNAPQKPKRDKIDSIMEYMNVMGNLGDATVQNHIAHHTARNLRGVTQKMEDMYYSAVTGKTGAQVRSSMEAERNAIIPKVAPVTPTREIAKDAEKAKEVVKPVVQPKMDDVKKAEEVVKPKPAPKEESLNDFHAQMAEERRLRHENEMKDPYHDVTERERENHKDFYEIARERSIDGGIHELNSEELVPIIHGGNDKTINAFMNKEWGYGTLQDMPMPNAQKNSNQGIMVHSSYPDRADMYATRAFHGDAEPSVLMGMVPRKYLYENDISDEFSMPTWFGDKIQNPKIIKQSDPEYANHKEIYKNEYLSKTQPWQKITEDTLNSTVPGTKETYQSAAKMLGIDSSNLDPKQLSDFVRDVRWDVHDNMNLFSQTQTRKL